ncbi:MAG: metallophosphoesterase [Tannerellaceae bacterium]|jgi:hypothetical protein|nr:metallophosphoesterase [Tannerellaceae bacterium]
METIDKKEEAAEGSASGTTEESPAKSTIVIGDVHGLTYWKVAVNDNPDCKYLFLGDYLDPYEEIDPRKLIDNLKEIIRLKQEQPQNVTLLLGNHDLHYITEKIAMGTRWNPDIAEEVAGLFADNTDLFQYAYQENNCIFTHAGISHKWFTDYFKGDIHKNIAEQLNNPTSEQEKYLFACGIARGGMDKYGGIFWADIKELYTPLEGFMQVVGHNRVPDIIDHTMNGGRIIFCDCLFNEYYLKI